MRWALVLLVITGCSLPRWVVTREHGACFRECQRLENDCLRAWWPWFVTIFWPSIACSSQETLCHASCQSGDPVPLRITYERRPEASYEAPTEPTPDAERLYVREPTPSPGPVRRPLSPR